MYLLNPDVEDNHVHGNIFTFHYVSIKSAYPLTQCVSEFNLHSTMYLLNLGQNVKSTITTSFTFHYVSIKSSRETFVLTNLEIFTFHYVSIKSHFQHMTAQPRHIYIPLCIY